jgi:hypothetical protein
VRGRFWHEGRGALGTRNVRWRPSKSQLVDLGT